MTAYELVIKLGRPLDVDVSTSPGKGYFSEGVREIRVPFLDRESAESAQRELQISVRPVHDAGGEDYRPVVQGEVLRDSAELPAPLERIIEAANRYKRGDGNP